MRSLWHWMVFWPALGLEEVEALRGSGLGSGLLAADLADVNLALSLAPFCTRAALSEPNLELVTNFGLGLATGRADLPTGFA